MYLVLLQTQSTGSAALEIIVMLLGAAIIGVVTTYFYMKSKYQQTIKELQSKLVGAEKSKDRMSEELRDVQKQLADKNSQNEELEKKYKELLKEEESLKEAAEETEKELKEKEELLKRISERKHLIDYSSIGQAEEKDKDDLKVISGIGPYIEERLHTLDIYTYEQISKFTKKDIEAVTEAIEFFPGRIERDEWVAQARELAAGKTT